MRTCSLRIVASPKDSVYSSVPIRKKPRSSSRTAQASTRSRVSLSEPARSASTCARSAGSARAKRVMSSNFSCARRLLQASW